jgi:Mrp family chromosome partitioning ATPase
MLRAAVLLEPIIGPGKSGGAATPASSRDTSSTEEGTPGRVTPDAGSPDRRLRKVVLVVSAGVEPTRALVVTNLAAAFAEAGEQALIVTTADLRERDPSQDTLVVTPVGAEPTTATVAESTRPTGVAGVRTLAMSSVIEGPGQLATRSPAVLAAAREAADIVIIDAPLLAVHDAEALVPTVDIVVVVAESWWTRIDQATQSGIFLRRISAPVVGAVLTEVRLSRKDLRRVIEPRQRTDAHDEDEDRLVGSSRMSRHGRRRGRDSGLLEA